MTTSGATLAAEVFFRIAGKLTLVQIGPYLNRALNIIEFGGQYEWDLATIVVTPNPLGNVALSADTDIGKDMFCLNSLDNSPIPRLTVDKAWLVDNSPSTVQSYASYYVDSFPTPPGYMRFRPALNPGQVVTVIYHKIPSILNETAGTSVPWTQQWMDDLLCDFAEMEIKRIANWVGWPELEQRCLARLKEAIGRHSSQRRIPSALESLAPPAPGGN